MSLPLSRKIVVSRGFGSLNNCIASNGPANMVRIETVGHAVGDGRKRFVRIGRGRHGIPTTERIARGDAFRPADPRPN
jgi:hypothetical protein